MQEFALTIDLVDDEQPSRVCPPSCRGLAEECGISSVGIRHAHLAADADVMLMQAATTSNGRDFADWSSSPRYNEAALMAHFQSPVPKPKPRNWAAMSKVFDLSDYIRALPPRGRIPHSFSWEFRHVQEARKIHPSRCLPQGIPESGTVPGVQDRRPGDAHLAESHADIRPSRPRGTAPRTRRRPVLALERTWTRCARKQVDMPSVDNPGSACRATTPTRPWLAGPPSSSKRTSKADAWKGPDAEFQPSEEGSTKRHQAATAMIQRDCVAGNWTSLALHVI